MSGANETTDKSPESIADALRLARKIEMKVAGALDPLAREMQIMKWPSEYRSIMWEAVARSALNRARESTGA